MKKHILIGFPSYSWVESKTVRTLVELVHFMALNHPDVRLSFAWRDGFPVAGCKHCYEDAGGAKGSTFEDARNHFAQTALAIEATHLFMIDSDMDYQGEDLLARLLAHDRDVVAPLFIRRSEPFDVLALRYIKESNLWKPITVAEQRSRKMIEIDATGFGCVLINTHVFRDLKFPWFVFESFKGRNLPEDLNFCRKVRRQGLRIFVDTSLHLDHIGAHRYRVKEGTDLQEMREEIEYDGPRSSDDSETSDHGSESGQPAIVSVGGGG